MGNVQINKQADNIVSKRVQCQEGNSAGEGISKGIYFRKMRSGEGRALGRGNFQTRPKQFSAMMECSRMKYSRTLLSNMAVTSHM